MFFTIYTFVSCNLYCKYSIYCAQFIIYIYCAIFVIQVHSTCKISERRAIRVYLSVYILPFYVRCALFHSIQINYADIPRTRSITSIRCFVHSSFMFLSRSTQYIHASLTSEILRSL